MYVYVTKFEGQPNLLKIGKSISPVTRNDTLSNIHGPIVYSGHYKVGDNYGAVEKYLHQTYSSQREKIHGDGGSEFFSDSIYDDVTKYLEKYRYKDGELIDEGFIRAQLKVERKRYYDLIGKLLGYKYSNTHTGEWHSMHVGFNDMMKIAACYDMGFSPKEIYNKYILIEKEGWMTRRFTTEGRVAMAYKLSTQGTMKEKNLEKLLMTAIENNKILPQ